MSSSNFPRFDSNMNTDGKNYDESKGMVAHHAVHYSKQYPSESQDHGSEEVIRRIVNLLTKLKRDSIGTVGLASVFLDLALESSA